MASAVNTAFVLDMQRKLYRWSTADTGKVFADLFNLVCDRRTIDVAWQRLSQNTGSQTPGTDRMTRHKVERRAGGVAAFLEEIREELRNGTYQPQPVRQRLIPKPGKPGKFRPLGIPTLKDRMVQMTLKLVLEPIFEADFYPTSYGFRRGRSTHDALARIQRRLHPGNGSRPSQTRYVIEGDIKGCFDAIDHHVLMERVRRRIKDRKVLRLILAFLKADIMIEGTLRHPVTGTPQGGIISPLLANVYLTVIDERYGRWSPRPREEFAKAAGRRTVDRKAGRPTFFVVRYADDFVVLVEGTVEQAEAERGALAEFLRQELRMELSMEKTRITDVREGFDFLGYRVVQQPAHHTCNRVGKLFIPKSKLKQLRHNIKVKVKKTPTGKSLTDLIDGLNLAELLPLRRKSMAGVRQARLVAGTACRALGPTKASRRKVERLVPPVCRKQTRGTATLERRSQTTTALQRRRDQPLSRPGHPDTERMECRTKGVVPARSRSLLGGNQHPRQTHARATRGKRHAWRAGCSESCTSGSEWGMKKLVPATG